MYTKCPRCRSPFPPGAEVNFCPSCGLSLQGTAAAQPPRRSAWVGLVDGLWDFFASTRVAVVLIFLIAIASIGGTLVEQEDLYQDWRPPELYYPFRYGPTLGPLLMKLGLTHAYKSSWFLALLLLIVVSLIICSLQRLVPLWRALHKPQVGKSPAFVRRLEVVGQVPVSPDTTDALGPVRDRLRRSGFALVQSERGLYGDRGRWSRYGPYIIHIGLIMVALSAATKVLPGRDITHDLWIAEGQTVVIPGTNLALRNDDYTMELYPSGMPRLFRTDAVLIEDGNEVKRWAIEVNHPLQHQGWEMYQASWKQEPGIALFKLVDTATARELGPLDIDLKAPGAAYPIGGGFRIEVVDYFSDFGLDDDGQPVNRTRDIVNPVFVLNFIAADGSLLGRQALPVAIDESQLQAATGAATSTAVPLSSGPLHLEQTGISTRWYTGIKAHRDLSIPYVFTGSGIVLFGMMLTFFVYHRQVWVAREGDTVLIGARTNKNRYGLKQEMHRLVSHLGGDLVVPPGASGPTQRTEGETMP